MTATQGNRKDPGPAFAFIAGLHRSGTSLLFELLRAHPAISGFRDTSAPHDEGQHLQSVYPADEAFGGPGLFGFDPASHLTEHSPLVTDANRAKLFAEWAGHWGSSRPLLLEKSPPNLVRSRFLQAMFPNSKIIVIKRHPIPVSLSTRKWSRTSLHSLFRHWVACHEIWEKDRPFIKDSLEISYEALVASPLESLNEILAFLRVDELRDLPTLPDRSRDQDYHVVWAALKRRPHLWPYLRFIETSFERRIRRWGYSFAVERRTHFAEPARLVPLPERKALPAGRPLFITGMHRSGTSLVAQAFSRAGLYLGDRLIGPRRFNPQGLFEDSDIIAFHESLLALNETAWHVPRRQRPLEVPPASRASALDLLRRKFDGRSPWGWKDPRATLFLDFWADVQPEAKWVLVYRNPAHVAWSLRLRGDLRVYSPNPVACNLTALRLWTLYARALVDFARRHPERAVLIRIPDDLASPGETLVNETVIGRWGFALRPTEFSKVYTPSLLKRSAPPWIEALSRFYLPARLALRQLDRQRERLLRLHLGDRRATGEKGSGAEGHPGARPMVCILSPRQGEYSETFVRAHITRLPAVVRVLYGGNLPLSRDNGRHLMSLFGRGMSVILKKGFQLTQTGLERAALRRYLRRERIDVVLAEFGPTGAAVWEVCRAAGVPLVVYFHGADATKDGWLRTHRQRYGRMLQWSAAVVAASREVERHLLALGAVRERLVYNPCGADTSLFTPGDPAAVPPRFLSVGRFVDKKAPHLTLLAFRRVLDDCPEAQLVMIGDGILLEACRQLARALRLEPAVEFRGARSHAEVAAAMREARAVVLHSVTTSDHDMEGTPVTILEAGAAGLPVVSTRHAGIADVVIHGETGFLVAEGDTDSMAKHMISLGRDPVLAARMGRRAREHVVAHFSMEGSVATLWAVLEKVVAQSGR
jgi:colanic acid/amylovoran biosynthesis glycosyltransferase